VLWAVAVLVFGVCSVHDFAFDPLLHGQTWQRTADTAAAEAADAHVPSGVTVSAANHLGPQLSDRTTVVLWDLLPRWTPWVVADVARPTFPFCGVGQQQAQVLYLLAHGYREVFTDDGYLVLHHPGPLPPLDTARSPGCS
jgi:hypothetical protein